MNHPNTATEYRPEKIDYPRTAVRTAFFVLIYHAVSWLLYDLFIGTAMDPETIPGNGASRIPWAMFFYGVGTLAVLGVVFVAFYYKNAERKRAYLTATSVEIRGAENVPEGMARYSKIAIKESLVCTLSAGVLWLIPTVFYTISVATSGRGYGYSEAWALEKFFVGFMGLCEPFQNAWIGLLLGMGILFAFHYFGRVYSHKQWQEKRIRR